MNWLREQTDFLTNIIINSKYTTMVIGRAFPDGTIEVAVAGHNPPLLLKNWKCTKDSRYRCPRVGLFNDAQYSVNSFTLDKSDALLLYTDGPPESIVNEVEYREKRVIDHLARTNGEAPKILIDGLVNNHKNRQEKDSKQADDITMLAIKRINFKIPL